MASERSFDAGAGGLGGSRSCPRAFPGQQEEKTGSAAVRKGNLEVSGATTSGPQAGTRPVGWSKLK